MKKKYKKFNFILGYSDHTLGIAAAAAAAANGAKIIEKHFTLSKNLYGSDAKHSMEPGEFKIFSETIRDIWKISKYKVDKNDIKKYKKMKYIFEKGIVANKILKKGHQIKIEDLSFKKPQNGFRADRYLYLIGKVLKKTIKEDQFFTDKHFYD